MTDAVGFRRNKKIRHDAFEPNRQGRPGMFQSRLLSILIATLTLAFQVSPCSCGMICAHELRCVGECRHAEKLHHRCSHHQCDQSRLDSGLIWKSPTGTPHDHQPCPECLQADHMILRIVDLDISLVGISRYVTLTCFDASLIDVARGVLKIDRPPPTFRSGVFRMQV